MEADWDKTREEKKENEWEGQRKVMEEGWEAEWKETKQKEKQEWKGLREAAIKEAKQMGEKEMAEWNKKIAEIREEDEAERKRLDESECFRKEKARPKN